MINDKIDKYLKEDRYLGMEEETPLDTKEFERFYRDYDTAIHKAAAKLEKDFTLWVNKNKVNDKSESLRQWVRDDMDIYSSRNVPKHIKTNIFNLVKY